MKVNGQGRVKGEESGTGENPLTSSPPHPLTPSSMPVVVHFVERFLAVTENWIYHQVVSARRYRPVVATEGRENADQFPFEPILFPDWGLSGLTRRREAHEGSAKGNRERMSPPETGEPDPFPKTFAESLCPSRLRVSSEAAIRQLRRRNRVAVPLQLLSRAYEGPVRAVGPALLHAHFGTQAVHLLRLRRRLGVPLVTTFYGYDASSIPALPGWRRWYARLFGEGDRFLVEGSAFRQRLLALGCPPEKVSVQHLGVDVEAIPFRPRQLLPGEPVRLLMAAGFREKKGHEYALRAFAEARRRTAVSGLTLRREGREGSAKGNSERMSPPETGEPDPFPKTFANPLRPSRLSVSPEPRRPQPPIELRLIGDGELRPRIEGLIRELGIGDAVVLLGALPHAAFLEEALRCHLFLSPSVTASDGDTEGGAPVGIIEAGATGMPVVASRHADIPEVVRDGETGWLAPERDVAALTAHLVGLLQHPETWPAIGERARRHIEAEYNLRTQAERLEAIYDEVISD